MSALSFSSQPIPQAKAYAYGSVYKGAPNWRDELLPGAVVKGPANITSAPALGSVVKGPAHFIYFPSDPALGSVVKGKW